MADEVKEEKKSTTARSQIAGFMEFVREHSVVGLAIGLAIGLKVTELVTSIVENLINPLVSLVLPREQSLQEASLTLFGARFGWGDILSNVIELIAVAAVVYFAVKSIGLDRLDKKKDK